MPSSQWREVMRRNSIIYLLVALLLLLFVLYTNKKCDHNVPVYNCCSDTTLLREYQETLQIMIQTDTQTANKFMRVMEKLNTEQ